VPTGLEDTDGLGGMEEKRGEQVNSVNVGRIQQGVEIGEPAANAAAVADIAQAVRGRIAEDHFADIWVALVDWDKLGSEAQAGHGDAEIRRTHDETFLILGKRSPPKDL